MIITRIDRGPRLSQAVVHGNTVYLAGQVGAPGASVTEQTRAILSVGAPTRATFEAKLSEPLLKVEIVITAAKA
ncbi:MAG TPA: hypothetical protein VKB94_00145 [Rhizomicrobium sp.]|nr:hypothetical protein [Rhizomicrobium sp.]